MFGTPDDQSAFLELLNVSEFSADRSKSAAVYIVGRVPLDGRRGVMLFSQLVAFSQAFLELVDGVKEDPQRLLFLQLLYANHTQVLLSGEQSSIQVLAAEIPVMALLRDVNDWEKKIHGIFKTRCSRVQTVLSKAQSLSRTRLEILRERQSYALYIALVLLFLTLVVVNAEFFDSKYQFIG